MMPDFKRKLVINLAVTGGAMLIAAATVFFLAFDINKRSQTIQEVRKELSFRFKSAEATASLKKDAALADQERLFLESILPIPDQLINFPREVSLLAKQHNIDLGFSFGKQTAGSAVEPGFISFSMTANASFNNWLEFIRALERSPYLVDLDSFNLASEGLTYRSVINGKVFSQ